MIARVRIAPVDRWCHWYTKNLNEKKLPIARSIVGKEIEIITDSMVPALCDPSAKMWYITERALEWLQSMETNPQNFGAICEHMLEMD